MVNKVGIKKLYNIKSLEDSKVLLNKKPPMFILSILKILSCLVIIVILAIIFLKVDISVDAHVKVEPSKDVITLKASSKGVIDEVYKNDGDTVEEGEKLLKLKSIEKEVSYKFLSETKDNLERKKEQLQRLYDSILSGENKLRAGDPLAYTDEYNNYIQSIDTLRIENNIQINAIMREVNSVMGVNNLKVGRQILSKGKKVNQDINTAKINQNKINNELNTALRNASIQGNTKINSMKTTTLSNISARLVQVEEALKEKNMEINGNKELMNSLEIKATKKGKIKLEKNITKGNEVELSQQLLNIFQEESKNKIIIYIQPKDIKSVQKNKSVTIKLDNESNSIVKAKVQDISEFPMQLSIGTKDNKEKIISVYEAKVEVEGGDEKLAYGMEGVANVKVGEETMWNYIKRHLFGGSKVSI